MEDEEEFNRDFNRKVKSVEGTPLEGEIRKEMDDYISPLREVIIGYMRKRNAIKDAEREKKKTLGIVTLLLGVIGIFLLPFPIGIIGFIVGGKAINDGQVKSGIIGSLVGLFHICRGFPVIIQILELMQKL